MGRRRVKPKFVPKGRRATIEAEEKKAAAEEKTAMAAKATAVKAAAAAQAGRKQFVEHPRALSELSKQLR